MDTKKLRQKILDLAIRGKLVPQDPNDEPASVLLERIRAEKERLVKEGKIKRSKKSASDDEIEAPFEIPESWEWVRLEDMVSPDCTLGYGIVQPMEDVLNGIPVVRPVDLTSPIIGIKGLKRIDEKISNSYQRTILKGGEILFCVRASVGKVGIASGQLRGANVTRGISPLRFDFEYLTKYVFYHLQSLFSQTEIKSYSRGATLQQINVEDLKLLLIAVPPLSEQKRIVDGIERWFTLIDELESNEGDLLKAIDKAKSKILDLAIHGKLVPQDPSDEPASVLLQKIREEKQQLVKAGKLKKKDLIETPISEDEIPFTIPDTWEWVRMSQIALDSSDGPFGSNLKRNHYTTNKEVRIIQLSNIGDEGWRDENTKYTTFEHLKSISRSEVFANDIIIAKMMPAGRAIICPSNDLKYVLSSDAVRFDFSNSLFRKYLYYAINSNVFKDQVYGEVQGITRVRTSLSKLRTYLIPLPPLAEQKRIVAKIEQLLGEIDKLKK